MLTNLIFIKAFVYGLKISIIIEMHLNLLLYFIYELLIIKKIVQKIKVVNGIYSNIILT